MGAIGMYAPRCDVQSIYFQGSSQREYMYTLGRALQSDSYINLVVRIETKVGLAHLGPPIAMPLQQF